MYVSSTGSLNEQACAQPHTHTHTHTHTLDWRQCVRVCVCICVCVLSEGKKIIGLDWVSVSDCMNKNKKASGWKTEGAVCSLTHAHTRPCEDFFLCVCERRKVGKWGVENWGENEVEGDRGVVFQGAACVCSGITWESVWVVGELGTRAYC